MFIGLLKLKTIKNVWLNLILLIYILMNTVKNYVTILFAVNLDRWAESCNTLDDFSSRVCVSNETKDLKLHVPNIMTWINESRILTKHISWKCERKFPGRKSNLNQNSNNNKCRCECKNPKEHQCETGYF